MHGEDDQIVPVKDSAKKSARLIKGAEEIYYPGLPHGLTATQRGSSQRRPVGISEVGSKSSQGSLNLCAGGRSHAFTGLPGVRKVKWQPRQNSGS